MDVSYNAGVQAAKNGMHINNSWPYDHEEFVKGYRSIKPQAKESLDLKAMAMNLSPDEYPYEEVQGHVTTNDLYLFRKKGTIHSANLNNEDLHVVNTLIDHGHVSKVVLKKK